MAFARLLQWHKYCLELINSSKQAWGDFYPICILFFQPFSGEIIPTLLVHCSTYSFSIKTNHLAMSLSQINYYKYITSLIEMIPCHVRQDRYNTCILVWRRTTRKYFLLLLLIWQQFSTKSIFLNHTIRTFISCRYVAWMQWYGFIFCWGKNQHI